MSLRRIKSSLPRPYSPFPSEFSDTFWQGLADGRFQLSHCRACDRLQFPPRAICPGCHSERIGWRDIAGRGTLYAHTRIHAAGGPFASMTPYSVGLIDLDEGIRILTRLMPDAGSLPLGSAIELAVVDHTDGPLFVAIDPTKAEDRR